MTRNRALMLAGYRCERCDSKRDLQVHHRTYERLGHEWDEDLEVLCDACHGEHHAILRAQHGDPVRLFAVLAGQAVHDRTVTTYADLVETVKVMAARLSVPYDSATVGAAVDLVIGKRSPFAPRSTVAAVAPETNAAPIDKGEALRIMFALRGKYDLPPIRVRMFGVTLTPEAQRAHEDKVRAQAAEMRRTAPRQPLHERLAEIFG